MVKFIIHWNILTIITCKMWLNVLTQKSYTHINLIIVMFLGGLWHGAAFSFGIWGLWHGIGLAIEKKFSEIKGIHKKPDLTLTLLRITLVFTFVSFGWLLFKLTNIQEAIQYLVAITENINIRHNYVVIINIVIYSLPVILYHLLYLVKSNNIYLLKAVLKHNYIIYITMFVMLLINRGIPGEFVYFQF